MSMVFWIIAATSFLLDAGIKNWIEKNVSEGDKIEVLNGNVWITKFCNRGIALGAFAKHRKQVIFVTSGMLMAIAGYLCYLNKKGADRLEKLGAAIVLGGGYNNLRDRIKKGYVTDYIRFRFGTERMQNLIFNISDFCILTGMVLLVIKKIKKG